MSPYEVNDRDPHDDDEQIDGTPAARVLALVSLVLVICAVAGMVGLDSSVLGILLGGTATFCALITWIVALVTARVRLTATAVLLAAIGATAIGAVMAFKKVETVLTDVVSDPDGKADGAIRAHGEEVRSGLLRLKVTGATFQTLADGRREITVTLHLRVPPRASDPDKPPPTERVQTPALELVDREGRVNTPIDVPRTVEVGRGETVELDVTYQVPAGAADLVLRYKHDGLTYARIAIQAAPPR